MAIRAVVFDIGNVLEITPDPQLIGMTRAWEARLGLAEGEVDIRMLDLWRAGSIGLCTEEDVYVGLRERVGLDDEQFSAFTRDFWSAYLGSPNDKLYAYVASLRPRYRIAMLSNSFVGAREREQSAYNYASMCDFIIYSHEVGMSKPDPRIYQLTCERLGVQPHEAIFVDDAERYLIGAQDVGMHGVLFRDTDQAIAEIESFMRDERT